MRRPDDVSQNLLSVLRSYSRNCTPTTATALTSIAGATVAMLSFSVLAQGDALDRGQTALEQATDSTMVRAAPSEAIANVVGYEDAGFFSRLFRRQVALTPAQYRRRFGTMRRALQSASSAPLH